MSDIAVVADASATDLARAWISTLTARGVRLEARGKRLTLYPKSSYGAMSNKEREVLRLHRRAIVALLNEGYHRAAGLLREASAMPTGGAGEPTVAPAPQVYCTFCMRTPCIGSDHELFEALHAYDPQAYWIFRERLRAKDDAEFEMRRRYGLTPIVWR